MGCGGSKVGPKINPNRVDLSHFVEGIVLGRGGFGIVKAMQKLSEPRKDEWFAMKKMKKKTIIEKNCVEQIFIEADLLSKLKHQFICNAYYAFQDPSALYLFGIT